MSPAAIEADGVGVGGANVLTISLLLLRLLHPPTLPLEMKLSALTAAEHGGGPPLCVISTRPRMELVGPGSIESGRPRADGDRNDGVGFNCVSP